VFKFATEKFGPPDNEADGFKFRSWGLVKWVPPTLNGIDAFMPPWALAVPVIVEMSVNCNGSRYAALMIFRRIVELLDADVCSLYSVALDPYWSTTAQPPNGIRHRANINENERNPPTEIANIVSRPLQALPIAYRVNVS
jgi:hypothetical protein